LPADEIAPEPVFSGGNCLVPGKPVFTATPEFNRLPNTLPERFTLLAGGANHNFMAAAETISAYRPLPPEPGAGDICGSLFCNFF
jgi:hypothetical protein